MCIRDRTDAVYDASELVFIALLLFLTPLFHKPVSEKHPYGYFQLESIFVIIKGVMMLSVTMGVSAEVLDSALSGGNPVNNAQVSLFPVSYTHLAKALKDTERSFTLKIGSILFSPFLMRPAGSDQRLSLIHI